MNPDPQPGKVYNYLTVIQEQLPKTKPRKWECRCQCGNLTSVPKQALLFGLTKSCGCFRRSNAREMHTIHGGKGELLYQVFSGMHNRCTNPNTESYQYYGARGIAVDPEWGSYEPFRDWALANGYRKGLTLDRRNGNLGYSANNCRWADLVTQNRNRQKHHAASSAFIGVSWNKRKSRWKADIKLPERRVFLGYFKEELEAAKARDSYIKDQGLENFVLNFI